MTDHAGEHKGLWAFFILTYVIMLLTWGAMAAFQIEGASANPDATAPSPDVLLLFALGGFSPSIAGIIMTWRVEGRSGLSDLWRRATRFNLGWKWYVAILLIPLLAMGLGVGVYIFRGGVFIESPLLAQPLNLVGFTILIFLGGPVSEEFGWRGFALDRLLARWSVLGASLVLAVFWALWHLPLFFVPGTAQQQFGNPAPEFIVFALGVIGMSVVYTWLHLGTRRSLWAVILYHAASNYTLSFLSTLTVGGIVDRLLIAGTYILAAVIIGISWKRVSAKTVHS